MKTVIMLVPTMEKRIPQELKETIVNYVGLANVDMDTVSDRTVPVVAYNGELSKAQKQNLLNYLDTKFSREDYAVFFIEYEKEPDDNTDVMTLVFKK